jgi:NTP pyrophosphatase (non-canonical NTP hydrolase)
VTLDEYAAWAASVGASPRAGGPEDRTLQELALGLASEVGEVAGVLVRWLRDGELRRDRLADELGDVAYYWARLSAVAGLAPSVLLARSRAHVEWRRAGRPAGGPAPGPASTTLEEYVAWAVGADPATPGGRLDARALCDAGLAMAGDAGEVVECLRRLGREGDRERDRLAGELGDVWRYWARLSVVSGVAPAELLAQSRTKIEGRLNAAGPQAAAGRRPFDQGAV